MARVPGTMFVIPSRNPACI